MNRRSLPLTPLQRAATLALVVVFVLAQTLGWLHRGLHGTSSAAQHVLAAGQAQAVSSEAGTKAFGHEVGTNECRLYDVLAQPGCASAPLVALPVAPPTAWLAAMLGDFVARWAALFDARGPPSAR